MVSLIVYRPYVLFFVLVSLIGCAKDYRLAPPPDSEQMTITVKVPEELETETMRVMYRSATCKRIRYGAFGERRELPGFHGIEVPLQRQGQSDLYVAKLPMDGGGKCKWHLSNVIFGVAYADPTRFGENVTSGAGGGIIVMFDHNRPSISGGPRVKVEGDLVIKKDYFPWLNEGFLGGYRKYISLAGAGDIYVTYQALTARHVYFEPTLHTDFLVQSEGPKVHKTGNYAKFTYPDGTVVADGRTQPSFLKLQAIRLAAEQENVPGN